MFLSGVRGFCAARQDTHFSVEVSAGKIAFIDLAGAPENELMVAISTSSSEETYLVTPVPMSLILPRGISSCITLKQRIFAHLDLDHVPESIQAGGRDALSLGIYAVDRGCVGSS